MTPLQEILNLYKLSLEREGETKVKVEQEPLKVEEGNLVELFPSPDGLEMVFLVFRKPKNGLVELLPLSGFWELATPDDVIVKVEGKNYIVQTDLGIDVPEEVFKEGITGRVFLPAGKLTPEEMEEVKKVHEGKKRGAGRMWGGPKGEFKKLEAKRYFPLFLSTLRGC